MNVQLTPTPLTLRHCLGVLFLHRHSIETVAAHPRSWVIGLAFVFVVTLARTYDANDLRSEPWHLILAAFAYPAPNAIMATMGGIYPSAADMVLANALLWIRIILFYGALGFLILLPVALLKHPARWVPIEPTKESPVLRPAIAALALSLPFLVFLPKGQREQHNATAVRTLMSEGKPLESVRLLSSLSLRELPPGFDPPPRVGMRDEPVHTLDAYIAVLDVPATPEVKRIYLEKLTRTYLRLDPGFLEHILTEAQFALLRPSLLRTPEGIAALAEYEKAYGPLAQPTTRTVP